MKKLVFLSFLVLFFFSPFRSTFKDGDRNVLNWLPSALINLHSDSSYILMIFVMKLAAPLFFL